MKKIVPFKKEIPFESLYEIRSISLEHSLKEKDNIISGEFTIGGTYKENETSLEKDFEKVIPFSISVDDKYDTKDVSVDINDFYYEVKDNNLIVNIEVSIDKLEELVRDEIETQEVEEVEEKTVIKSIFEELDSNERYSVYKVHVVKENDTIESIMNDYDINRELLEEYNNLSDIKIGDKIIIPSHES